jgi:SPFH domain-Band 7 family
LKPTLTFLIFLLSCLNILLSQTLITGLITENKTFTQADNPIRIQKAAVQQGVTLRFEGACQVTIVDKLELAGVFQMVGNQGGYASLSGGIRYSGNTSDIDLAFVQLKNATLETFSVMNIRNCDILSSKLHYGSPKEVQTIAQCVFKYSELDAGSGSDDALLHIQQNTFSDCKLNLTNATLIENNQFIATNGGEAENKLRSWRNPFEIVGNSFKGYKNTALHLIFEREEAKMLLLHNVFDNNGTHIHLEYDANYDTPPKLTTEGNQFLKYKQYALQLKASSTNIAKPTMLVTIASTFGDKKTPEALAKAIYDFDDDFHLRLKIQIDTTNANASTPPVAAPQPPIEPVAQVETITAPPSQMPIVTKPNPFLSFFRGISDAFGDLPISLKMVVFSWFWVFFEKMGWGFMPKTPIPPLFTHLLKHTSTILLAIGTMWVVVFSVGFNPRFSDTLGKIPFGVWFFPLMSIFLIVIMKYSVQKPGSNSVASSSKSSNPTKKEAIKKAIENELIEIIEWKDNSNNTVVWQFPNQHNNIKNGAQLVVRESQMVILMFEGQFGDCFYAGTHRLGTGNMPIITTLENWKYGFKNPFKIDIYYISTRQFINIGWKTEKPFIVKDAEFGTIRLKASGKFALRVTDALRFLKELHGTKSEMHIEEVVEQLKTAISTKFADTLAESKISISDLAANYLELGEQLLPLLKDDFEEYGLEITRFYLEHITLPPDIEAKLDKRY